MKLILALILSINTSFAQSLIGSGANQVPTNGMLGSMAFESYYPKVFSASVSAAEVISSDEVGFIASCTDAAPSVCTLRTGLFLKAPLCWSQGSGSYVSSTSLTSATVERSTISTAFTLFCLEKR